MYGQMKLLKSKYLSHIFIEPVPLVPLTLNTDILWVYVNKPNPGLDLQSSLFLMASDFMMKFLYYLL